MSTMSKHADKTGAFQKVGECLYRYTSNGVYYARIKADGKEIRQSLRTTDRQTANRELAALKRKHSQVDGHRVRSRLLSCATATSKQCNIRDKKP
jgi:hypothetical protein